MSRSKKLGVIRRKGQACHDKGARLRLERSCRGDRRGQLPLLCKYFGIGLRSKFPRPCRASRWNRAYIAYMPETPKGLQMTKNYRYTTRIRDFTASQRLDPHSVKGDGALEVDPGHHGASLNFLQDQVEARMTC